MKGFIITILILFVFLSSMLITVTLKLEYATNELKGRNLPNIHGETSVSSKPSDDITRPSCTVINYPSTIQGSSMVFSYRAVCVHRIQNGD
jgi:hypothetical protein